MRIAVGLSGGVDSSVAAAILKEQGHKVIGITMDTWSGDDVPALKGQGCYGPSEHEVEQARSVAKDLEIPFHVLDLKEEYNRIVMDYFKSEYVAGRTPNPCLRCNPRVKFGAMLDKARASGIEFEIFATGHYARVDFDAGSNRYVLSRATDHTKDQSYGLIFLSQEQLSKVIFPLGGITKKEVRRSAKRLGLVSSEAPESQDFYGGDIADIIGAKPSPGKILDSSGKQVGTHDGIWHYTIGQRRGLGVAAREPMYVKSIDSKMNVVTVAEKAELYSKGLVAGQVNLVSVDAIPSGLRVGIRIRHTQDMISGTAELTEDGKLLVKFDEPQWAVAPGQAVAIYDGDIVLAGGIIETSI
jgi:tRNA-specific 2-thiouridylase